MEFEQIFSLIRTVSDSNITEFDLREGEFQISLRAGRAKDMPQDQRAPAGHRAASASENSFSGTAGAPEYGESGEGDSGSGAEAPGQYSGENTVFSPLVGTFYRSSSPDQPPFVQVGDLVKKGQILGLVEAMKLMNEIESEFDGTVEKILAENEQMVEFGQPLFVIR